MYNTTAFLYEATAAFEQPERACQELHELLLRAGLSPPAMLGDFGAGTGLMSILLAKQGWRVYGVEISPAMMAVAQEKTDALPQEVQSRLTWTQGDITHFELPDGLLLDGAICLHNTINHLVEWPQVKSFFRSAYRALKPNGVLVLDSDTLATFIGFFNHEPTIVWDDGIHRLIRACQFNADSGRAHHVAVLEQYDNGTPFPVSREDMPLQYHKEPELFSAFTEAGFQLEQVESFNPNPALYAGDMVAKVLWTLRKPA